MSSARKRDLQSLEQELDGKNYQELLWRIKQREPFYGRFNSWRDVVAFMRAGTSEDPEKDIVLRAIFRDYKHEPDLKVVLYVVFWPALTSIDYHKRHWNPDAEERWQDIQWVFIEIITGVDISKRSERLVQHVYNSIVHRLYDEYSRTWERQKREIQPDINDPIDDPLKWKKKQRHINAVRIDTDAIDLCRDAEAKARRLREHLERGQISEADFHLILGTRLLGKSLSDYAQETGQSYQAIKKRRQRAESVIERFEADS